MIEDMVRSGQALPPTDETGGGTSKVRDVAYSLTKVQRMYVSYGSIQGDCAMSTVRALKRKGLFHLVIDSPNGQWGFMRLTPLGEAVRAHLTHSVAVALEARITAPSPSDGEGAQEACAASDKPTEPNQGTEQ